MLESESSPTLEYLALQDQVESDVRITYSIEARLQLRLKVKIKVRIEVMIEVIIEDF